MPKKTSRRDRLLRALGGELRRMGIVTVLFHQTVAQRIGLNATDSRAFSLLQETGPVPAGRLAELTGLSTGAVTAVIDRLEAAGYARRESDPSDRRRVMVTAVEDPERDRRIRDLTGSLHAPLTERMERYSDDELMLILDFLDTGIDFLREQTSRLQEAMPE